MKRQTHVEHGLHRLDDLLVVTIREHGVQGALVQHAGEGAVIQALHVGGVHHLKLEVGSGGGVLGPHLLDGHVAQVDVQLKGGGLGAAWNL